MNRKLLVDQVSRLDMKNLNGMGVFNSGPDIRRTSGLRFGKSGYGSVGFYLVEDSGGPTALRFIYKFLGNYSEEKTNYDYEVSLASTPCFYGGKRWWFICPLQAGQSCVQRCRVIYITPYNDHFGCRECCGLTYECRQKHGEFYYEYFHKPEARFEAAVKNLRSRSPKKTALAWREIVLMRRRFEEFDRLSAIRFKKFMERA